MRKERKNIILFRENIKNRRIELNITQQELAKKVGYKSGTTISKIERGIIDTPFPKIDIFAQALNTTPEKIISWQERAGRLLEVKL